ncbi:MAG: hypothetical protein JO019_01845 [Candidatus Kaiserbacteria bacterium]|nr:hypothetical protein [Candidatus Kaiserbacteria bacterium]
MKSKVVHAFLVSLEWRVIAFVITNIFFWITTGQFWKAAGYALTLQIILFVTQVIWQLYRHEFGMPLVPRRRPHRK